MEYNNYRRPQQGARGDKKKKEPAKVVADFYNPYIFVPFADHVFQLSKEEVAELEYVHDVPVEGSLSGRIKIDFESVTPFCVKGTDDKFYHIDGQYYVPGSTVKGMIRSVFEILTYANAKNSIDNNRYSMRDLRNSDYKLKSPDSAPKSGFLIKMNGKYYIHPCTSKPMKYEDIERIARVHDLKKKKSVREKYALVKNRIIRRDYGNLAMWFFSGFMNNKKHEFLFDIPFFSESELIPISDPVWKDFVFIHEKENVNKSWEYWRQILKNFQKLNMVKPEGVAPCFFRATEDDSEVKDLGFSFLYRQPYDKTLHQFLPEAHQKSTGIDLAQAVFGYVEGRKALKGRVQFGNAFIESAHLLGEQKFVLGSPKPTFYPFYLQQDEKAKGKLNTYFGNSTLSGAKRYLLHEDAEQSEQKGSAFYPLDKNTKFSTYVYFHNLHDYELGALLAAITFCQNEDCMHSMGYAKPFGYGKIKVNACVVEECEKNDVASLITSFIGKITDRCGISEEDWRKSVESLFIIARGKYGNKSIRYPKLDDNKNNEFDGIKNKKFSLRDFSPVK